MGFFKHFKTSYKYSSVTSWKALEKEAGRKNESLKILPGSSVLQRPQTGINSRRPHERPVMVALDMSKAFEESTLPRHMKRWVTNYLQGRKT